MSEIDDIIREIDAYIAASRIAPSTFGRLAVNDGKLVARLKGGGNLTLDVAAKIRAFIADNPPEQRSPRRELTRPFPVAGGAA